MNPTGTPPPKSPWQYAINPKVVALGGEVGCLTLFLVLAAVFGGIYLDRLFGTKPVILLILVLSAGPVSLVLTYFLAQRAVRDINLPKPENPAGSQSSPRKEEETGE